MAIFFFDNVWSSCWIDISTGLFKSSITDESQLLSIIDQIEEIDIQNLLPFLSNFKGIERRMDIYKLDSKVVIDDYAEELEEDYGDNIKFVKGRSEIHEPTWRIDL